jgi:hypothetical protein
VQTRTVAFLTLMTAVMVPAGLLLSYWVFRDVPDVPCFQPVSDELRGEIDDYRQGATPIHVFAGLVVGVALAALSATRQADAGRPRRPGWPTLVGLAAYAGYLISILADRDVAEAGAILGWVGLVTGPLAVASALITLLLLRRGRTRAAAVWAATTAWIVALTLIPGALGLIVSIDDPFCVDL